MQLQKRGPPDQNKPHRSNTEKEFRWVLDAARVITRGGVLVGRNRDTTHLVGVL